MEGLQLSSSVILGRKFILKKFDELVEDYSTTHVPDDKTVSGLKVALVVIGTSIALPAFLMGAKIGTALGLTNAILAFFAGGAVLMFLGSLTAMVASKARLTTYMLAQFAFGPVGGKFVNIVLAFTMFGWFGVNAFMFSKACQSMVESLTGFSGATSLYIVIGSALMVATTIFGFKSLSKLTLYAVPLLACILGVVVTLSYHKAGAAIFLTVPSQPMPFGLAVSAIAGGNMVMVAAMPDLARYTANKRQATAVPLIFLPHISTHC
jgi:cytosine permease